MRPITFTFTLLVCLHLLPGTATADSGGGGWTWPVRGPVLTGYRNGSDPYAAGQHRGVDIGSPVGARVVAATGGTVTFVGVAGSSGLTVAERTADGRFDLSYLHLSSAVVHRGDSVAGGDALGAVGTSGQRSAEAPHLHFGVREAGSRTAYRDPLDFLAPPPAGDAPDPRPEPVPVASPRPASPEVEPTDSAEPVAPALPAPTLAPSGLPALSAPAQPAVRLSTHRFAPAVPRPAGAPKLSFSQILSRPRTEAPVHPSRATTRAAQPAPPAALRGPGAAEVGASAETAAAPGPHNHRASRGTHHGIDLGWLAACLGLVAAATALGHPDGTRRLTARGRARLGAVLRPASRGS
jgi:hypothetical protein